MKVGRPWGRVEVTIELPEYQGRNEYLLTEQLVVFYARVGNSLIPKILSL